MTARREPQVPNARRGLELKVAEVGHDHRVVHVGGGALQSGEWMRRRGGWEDEKEKRWKGGNEWAGSGKREQSDQWLRGIE